MNLNTAREKTESLLKEMDSFGYEWVRRWSALQMSKATGKPYGGSNQFILQYFKGRNEYKSNTWATFNKINKLDGSVLKGEKGVLVVKYETVTKLMEVLNPQGEKEVQAKSRPIIIGNTVFNLDQTNLKDEDLSQWKIEGVNDYEDFDKLYVDSPQVAYGPQPCYIPAMDVVQLPFIENFSSPEFYRSTRQHEKFHSTGSKNRLNREGITGKIQFGSPAYAKEEIITEMANLLAHVLLEKEAPIKEDTLGYIKNWKQSKNGEKEIGAMGLMSLLNQSQSALNYWIGDMHLGHSVEE